MPYLTSISVPDAKGPKFFPLPNWSRGTVPLDR